MDTLKYIVKRLLMALLILFGVSVIIYALARMMPNDYVTTTYSSALQQGTMTQDDIDRINALYGLDMPDAYLNAVIGDGEYAGSYTRRTKVDTYNDVCAAVNAGAEIGRTQRVKWYEGSYAKGDIRLTLSCTYDPLDKSKENPLDRNYTIGRVVSSGDLVFSDSAEGSTSGGSGSVKVDETVEVLESGKFDVNDDGSVTLTPSGGQGYTVAMNYRAAGFWDKTKAILGGYFGWLGKMFKGDLGVSFKYKRPVATVIFENMDVSFIIAFIATLLEFLIAIPLGIKAATHQYGVVDYTVTVLTMMGISLPTFFLAALFIRVFAVQFGWFDPSGGLVSTDIPRDASWIVKFGDMAWHMVLPMTVLVILSVGSLMRYTRTNMLEVMNSDYIRTARAKGLSEHTVVYKHAFRNTMVPLVTMLAGTLPGLFGGAMITETVFAIPGIGKMAYDALVVADIPFIMGYNMFLAILTVLGTLLSDLMYAVVDPRVKLGK